MDGIKAKLPTPAPTVADIEERIRSLTDEEFSNLVARTRSTEPAEPADRADHGFIDDGMGSEWPRCKADCRLEVVRTGKVQCECSEPDLEEFRDALEPGEQP